MTTQIFSISVFSFLLVLTVLSGYLANRFFLRLIKRSTDEMNNDPTNYKFLRRVVVSGIYIIGFSIAIYMVDSLRSLAASLLAGAGILAVAIGFASQQALSNIISGFFIVIFKPFRINDRLALNEMTGIVEDITLRHVVIRDFENKRIIIPNSVISNVSIVNANLVDDRICKWIDVSISYTSSIDLARSIMKDVIINHPLHIDPRKPEQIEEGEELAPVRLISMGDSAINLRAWAWAKDPVDGFLLSCDLLEIIKKRFDAEGIEIPFPQRDLHIKNSGLKLS